MPVLYTSDTIYRPPLERDSAFLEVAAGCSWHRCRFCDFSRDEFRVFSPDEIRDKLRLLGQTAGDRTRLFLLGCNAFCLSFERLRTLLLEVQAAMPRVREVSMYARADDILRKTPQELAALHELSLCDLHVGVESGSAAVLQVQHLKAGVPPGVCIAERSRAVGRAVVGQHTAELGETLGRDGVKTQGQVLCRDVDGHHHGNAGGTHASTSA